MMGDRTQQYAGTMIILQYDDEYMFFFYGYFDDLVWAIGSLQVEGDEVCGTSDYK